MQIPPIIELATVRDRLYDILESGRVNGELILNAVFKGEPDRARAIPDKSIVINTVGDSAISDKGQEVVIDLTYYHRQLTSAQAKEDIEEALDDILKFIWIYSTLPQVTTVAGHTQITTNSGYLSGKMEYAREIVSIKIREQDPFILGGVLRLKLLGGR